MSDRDRPKTPPTPTPDAKPGTSGRVQFDERGQAVWEWAVKTGMFDRNASTQRIQKLLDQPTGLEIVDYDAAAKAGGESRTGETPSHPGSAGAGRTAAPAGRATTSRTPAAPVRPGSAPAPKPAALPDRSGGFNPYERAQPDRPGAKPRDSQGRDPYSSGPAKKPEGVSFNPYERTPRK